MIVNTPVPGQTKLTHDKRLGWLGRLEGLSPYGHIKIDENAAIALWRVREAKENVLYRYVTVHYSFLG